MYIICVGIKVTTISRLLCAKKGDLFFFFFFQKERKKKNFSYGAYCQVLKNKLHVKSQLEKWGVHEWPNMLYLKLVLVNHILGPWLNQLVWQITVQYNTWQHINSICFYFKASIFLFLNKKNWNWITMGKSYDLMLLVQTFGSDSLPRKYEVNLLQSVVMLIILVKSVCSI